ncbi:RING-H2 finger protein ATL66-like [Primulina huaijiensis]|uniref:RING-H2 finger protein ATL66-like n=1 Tax=Primulina huaijiensis TaxID=1492673 RepID=UPI003CC70630
MSPDSPLRWHYDEFDDGNFRIHGRTLYFILFLFSIILSINFLFFFSRWACRRFCHILPTPSTVPPPLPVPRGLDLTSINSLQILLYKSTGSDVDAGKITETECCICIGPFKEGDKMKMLPECKHCFHSECVDEWLNAQSSCPLCRASLV